MHMPGYPAGVPNPQTRHVHPYPTRFHGGNSVRPVFTFPFAYNPQIVTLPSGVHGLGDYNVGQGVFRPGGYGGGVFDGNLAGLGALEDLGAKALQSGLTQTTTKAPTTSYAPPAPAPIVSPEMSASTAMIGGGGSDNKWLAFLVGGGLAIGAIIYLKKRKKI